MRRMTIAASLTQDPLWTRARAMFTRAVAAVGAPAAIAAIATLSKLLRRDIVAWLYPLECIVRRLLIAEAATLHRAEIARAKRNVRVEYVPLRGMAQTWIATPPAAHCAKASSIDTIARPEAARPNDPATWSAPFSFALPRNERLVPNARAPRIRALWGPPPPPAPERTPRIIRPERASLRLARRFEALRRVLENPAPYAERLAHMLAREVRRFSAVVRRAVLKGARTDDYDPADPRLSLDALGAAFDAPEAFEDSS
jgi:hypothetical protein